MGSGASRGASKYLAEKYSEVLEEVAGSHEFYFISKERLLEFPTEDGSPPLPSHQELLRQGWLIKKNIVFYTLLKGGYEDIAMISHRWGTPAHPDPNNEQVKKVQDFLRENPHIMMVWLDYGSIPQGKRSAAQDKYIRTCLDHISLLYLSLPVLIIYDKQYASRFWCNFEMYLSLRTPSVEGIGSAGKEELESQFHFCCVGSAKHNEKKHKELCMMDWKDLTAAEAATLLSEDDIMVTNRRDKDEQLENLAGLDLRIKDIVVKKAVELEEMSQRRWQALKQVKSGAGRLLAETLKAEEEKKKRELEETQEALKKIQLERADLEKLMADVTCTQELDKEMSALGILYSPGSPGPSGSPGSPGSTSPRQTVWNTNFAFLAKLNSGKAVAWGHPLYGANLDAVQSRLDTEGLDKVWSSGGAFLAKLNSGKAVAWGHADCGAILDAVQSRLDTEGLDKVWSNNAAFLAKLNSGKVVAWGLADLGANLEAVQSRLDTEGLDKVWSSGGAFLAKLNSGKAVAWGHEAYGARLDRVQSRLDTEGLDEVWSTCFAFVAKLNSGKAVAWGHVDRGANLEAVQSRLDTEGLDKVWSTRFAFLAKLNSGKAVAWGNADYGANLEAVQSRLDTEGLDKVWSTGGAFLAKLNSGKAVAWGHADYGANLEAVQSRLDTEGLDKVWSNGAAFLAKLNSGKVVAWGSADRGANLEAVQSRLETEGI